MKNDQWLCLSLKRTLKSFCHRYLPRKTIYLIFKEGQKRFQIQKNREEHWLNLDAETALPLFDADEEINTIGRTVISYVPEEGEEGTDKDLLD